MNLKRILTTVVGLPIVIVLLAYGNKYLIDIVFAVIALLAMYEYTKCVSHKAKVISWIGYVCALSICFLHVIPENAFQLIITIGIPSLLLILFLHVIFTNMRIQFQDIAFTFFGILYILGFIIFLPLTYGIEGEISGKIYIWYIMFSAWGTDTFAYLVGKHWGKIKFSKVSPNKTVEGCVAGTVGSMLMTIVYTFFINQYLGYTISYVSVAFLTFILSIIGQIGDFSASVIKRYFDVKDFSELFPGHGGMIDRIDSVMFIAPFAYILLGIFL